MPLITHPMYRHTINNDIIIRPAYPRSRSSNNNLPLNRHLAPPTLPHLPLAGIIQPRKGTHTKHAVAPNLAALLTTTRTKFISLGPRIRAAALEVAAVASVVIIGIGGGVGLRQAELGEDELEQRAQGAEAARCYGEGLFGLRPDCNVGCCPEEVWVGKVVDVGEADCYGRGGAVG